MRKISFIKMATIVFDNKNGIMQTITTTVAKFFQAIVSYSVFRLLHFILECSTAKIIIGKNKPGKKFPLRTRDKAIMFNVTHIFATGDTFVIT